MRLEQRFDPNKELDDDALADTRRARLEIEVDEPASLILLDILCHIELMYAQDHRGEYPKIPKWRRHLAHLFSQYDWSQHYIQAYLVTKTDPPETPNPTSPPAPS